ncbi:uncharacterized protein LOC123699802 [Colias croceus]|uniref:uncharacterized protein LOC123699802 n=1 Tax=Colias crocea TaxID=72248 RepID=UPI001E28178D|nr:uncharacterized protein LOC123699802 [Colias croceus]XP_045502789.1 uncharacterized protein LOC123699802 [Colias croceus]
MERYKEGPDRASQHASRTKRNVWRNVTKHLRNPDIVEGKVENDPSNVNHDTPEIKTRLGTIDGIIATEDTVDDDFDEEVRKNVWSDVDDELYIANVIKQRTSNEVKRVKRDTSYSSVSGYSEVVNSDKLDKFDMWELEPTDLTECDCLGPPPEFLLPPPPRPPFLQAEYYCGDDPIPDLETCDSEPKIDAYNHSGPSLQTSAVIALCSIVLVLGIFIGAILVWKHKRKVTNLLPSKSTAPSQSSGSQRRVPPPAPLYEDLQDLPRRPPLPQRPDIEPQLEMVETKRPNCQGRVFVCGTGGSWRGGNPCGNACNAPVYEELPHRSDDSVHSDDHFAEDELSLVGDVLPCRTCSRPPPQSLPHRPRQHRLDRRPKSLERRRAHRIPRHVHPPDPSEFHEGVLLDALLRLYPQVGTVGARPAGPMPMSAGGAWPGGELPGIACWRGPRASPKPPSGDSSFGSDSGYSNNTCGTCGTRASSRHRLSAEIPLS